MSYNYLNSNFTKALGMSNKNIFLRRLKAIMYYVDSIILFFIKKPVYRQEKKKKVLVIYNLVFGDGVIWRCSAIHLRKIYPKSNYEITLICQKGIDKLYEKDDTYDKIIPIDFNKATVNLKERIKNFKTIRNKYYDIVLDPVGIFEMTTNILYMKAAMGKEKIGLRDINVELHCSMKKINKIYNKIIQITEPNLSLIEYYNSFINGLTDKKVNIIPSLEKLKTTPTKLKLPKEYFIVFPCASTSLKRWPIDRYVEIAHKIYEKTKFKLVLVGTDADKEAIDEFKSKLDIPYEDFVCKTSLNDYIDVIKNAKLVVTNDTSAYHIAVIEEVPVAIISGAYTYERYVLYHFKGSDKYRKPCIVAKNKKCKNCNNRCKFLQKNDKIWPCLNEITVDYAWQKIEHLIEENYGGTNEHRKITRNNS